MLFPVPRLWIHTGSSTFNDYPSIGGAVNPLIVMNENGGLHSTGLVSTCFADGVAGLRWDKELSAEADDIGMDALVRRWSSPDSYAADSDAADIPACWADGERDSNLGVKEEE